VAGRLRAKGGRGHQQYADADPVDRTHLADRTQESAHPLRLYSCPWHYTELEKGTVYDGDENRERASKKERQIPHVRTSIHQCTDRLARAIADVNTVLYGVRMQRLTAQDWIDFALAALAREGSDALKADVLARKLGVSRGSFYWHFSDLRTFHRKVIARWRQVSTEAIIADIERHSSREMRLEALLRHAFGDNAALDVRMRAWAANKREAAQAVGREDGRRREYIERLLVEAGVAQSLAATRAQLMYWTYLGAASSRGRLTGRRLERMVAELKHLALSGLPGTTLSSAPADAGRRPRPLACRRA
jgi:AcrR family transcriptional regulator